METTIIKKIDLNVLKNDIKKLVEEQRFLRNQRKTVYIKGERTMEPWVAAYKHTANREKLRIMYAAYGLMRGKSFEQIEKRSDTTTEHPLVKYMSQINKMVETYSKFTKDVEVTTE